MPCTRGPNSDNKLELYEQLTAQYGFLVSHNLTTGRLHLSEAGVWRVQGMLDSLQPRTASLSAAAPAFIPSSFWAPVKQSAAVSAPAPAPTPTPAQSEQDPISLTSTASLDKQTQESLSPHLFGPEPFPDAMRSGTFAPFISAQDPVINSPLMCVDDPFALISEC